MGPLVFAVATILAIVVLTYSARMFRRPRPTLLVQLLGSWWLVGVGVALAWQPTPPFWLAVAASTSLVFAGLLWLTKFAKTYALSIIELGARRIRQRSNPRA